ncbi:MAG TPA: hypothetical protein VF857_00125, partial [Spirochaetota bacterium]
LAFVFFVMLIVRRRFRHLFNPKLIVVGGFSALSLIFYMSALRLTYVSYIISVKRMSIVFAIALGALFFREKDLLRRLAGGAITLAGIILLALWK